MLRCGFLRLVSFGLWMHLDLTFSWNPSKMHGFERHHKNKSTPSIIILSVAPNPWRIWGDDPTEFREPANWNEKAASKRWSVLTIYLGVHIGVYQPWYSVLFGNTWYKEFIYLRCCKYYLVVYNIIHTIRFPRRWNWSTFLPDYS